MAWTFDKANPFPKFGNTPPPEPAPTKALRVVFENASGLIVASYSIHPDNVSRIPIPSGCRMALTSRLPNKDERFLNATTGHFRKTPMPKKAKKK